MKCNEIHDNLENKEVRTFLAKKIGYGYYGEVESLELQIKKLQEELALAKESKAARDLIKLNGWQEFDVSDLISHYKMGMYFPFIGTEEEIKILEECIEINNKGDRKNEAVKQGY